MLYDQKFKQQIDEEFSIIKENVRNSAIQQIKKKFKEGEFQPILQPTMEFLNHKLSLTVSILDEYQAFLKKSNLLERDLALKIAKKLSEAIRIMSDEKASSEQIKHAVLAFEQQTKSPTKLAIYNSLLTLLLFIASLIIVVITAFFLPFSALPWVVGLPPGLLLLRTMIDCIDTCCQRKEGHNKIILHMKTARKDEPSRKNNYILNHKPSKASTVKRRSLSSIDINNTSPTTHSQQDLVEENLLQHTSPLKNAKSYLLFLNSKPVIPAKSEDLLLSKVMRQVENRFPFSRE
ncbi:hypothetical protein [Legionella fairfieldensis]|uniref:hypothetical protein n=2 Tax=Legionella fairfieldensis TaxID=45064 RepID=UPI001041BC20|nr:hypothetical protein [Legionella fairfieldensis]